MLEVSVANRNPACPSERSESNGSQRRRSNRPVLSESKGKSKGRPSSSFPPLSFARQRPANQNLRRLLAVSPVERRPRAPQHPHSTQCTNLHETARPALSERSESKRFPQNPHPNSPTLS